MLRSLVGSEMCIRDRNIEEGESPQILIKAGDWFGAKVSKPDSYCLAGCTCLLYTSDAADDLLCVDLGGRRIIKKKITHTTKSPHLAVP